MSDNNTPLLDNDEISLLDLLQTIVDNLRLLVLGPLTVGLAALGVSFAVPPSYSALTTFLPPQQQQGMAASMLASLGALSGLAGAATGLKSPADQYIAFLKSNSVEDALIERFKLIERYKSEFKQDARTRLEGSVKIISGKDGLISITVEDTDASFAADLANAYVEELTRLLSRLALTEAQQRRKFFEKQLEQTKDRLTQAEIALNATGVSSNVLKSNPVSAVAAVAALQAQVTAQEVKLGAMRGYLAETAPDFQQALVELTSLRSQLSKLSQDKAQPTAPGQSNYVSAYRQFKYQETLFELFARQFEMAKVDESREGAVIQVLDKATPPERKSAPKKAQIAIVATLAAGFALLLFVFVRQTLVNARQDKESADKLAQLRSAWRKALGRR